MPFDNVRLDYSNVSNGPVAGRVYSIDHVADVLVEKTYPGGTLVSTTPLNVAVLNEVIELEYDGYYFWALSRLGLTGNLGVEITKWKFNTNRTLLEKQVTSTVTLLHTPTFTYSGEAVSVHRLETTLDFFVTSGTTSLTLDSVELLEPGNVVYIGPSSAASGEVEERTVQSIAGNVVTLTAPISVNYNVGDKVIYRKDLWLFNNYNANDPSSGSLVRINSYTGAVLSYYSGHEWQGVTAATARGGNLAYVRGNQYLEFKPIGLDSGYKRSLALENVKNDNNTVIKVHDLIVDNSSIYKLQLERHIFNSTTEQFDDEESVDDKYNIDQESFAARVKSITAIRDYSYLFGSGQIAELLVEVLDQYGVAVFNRAMTVQENDAVGSIVAGFEAFNTNTQGRGLTKYTTNISPDFNVPAVTVKDVVTKLSAEINLVQLRNVNTLGFVEQQGQVSSLTFLAQQVVSGSAPVAQIPEKISAEGYLVQDLPSPATVFVVQDEISNTCFITQNQILTSDVSLSQQAALTEPVNVRQYNFLIFAVPTPYSEKNDPATNILVRIVSFTGLVLNLSTLTFLVNGVDVTSQVVATPFTGGFELLYNPATNFPYSSTVSVSIQINDTDTPSNRIRTDYTFDIVPDYKKPVISEVYPPNKSVGADSLTPIYAVIKDYETGLDLNSIEMYVEGRQVTPQIIALADGFVKVLFEPDCKLLYTTEIVVAVSVADNEGNRLMYSWTFTVESSPGVLFTTENPSSCSVLVPVTATISTEAYGLEEGINIDSLSVVSQEKAVPYALVPKVYRKE